MKQNLKFKTDGVTPQMNEVKKNHSLKMLFKVTDDN